MKQKKILVIRSGAIGDVIMCTPFLRNLGEYFPDSKISFLVGKWSGKVLKNNPYIEEVIEFEDEIVIKKNAPKVLLLIKKIKERKFDLCFILDKSWMWILFAFLTGIKERIGFSRRSEGILNSKSVPFDGSKHEIDYNLSLLSMIGIRPKKYSPEIYTTQKESIYAAAFLKKIKKNARIIGIAPGGAENPGQAAEIKRWPLKRYIELTNSLNYNFIIFGNKKDRAIAKKIIEGTKNKNVYDAAGNSIYQAKELMERCSLVVTHDSGSLHIASAAKTKIIALFGPTPKQRFAPKKAVTISAKTPPCYTIYGKFRNCKENQMNEITTKEVVNAIEKNI